MKITFSFDTEGEDGYDEKALSKVYAQAEDMYMFLDFDLFQEILRPVWKYDSFPTNIHFGDLREFMDSVDLDKIRKDHQESFDNWTSKPGPKATKKEQEAYQQARNPSDEDLIKHLKPYHLDGSQMTDILQTSITRGMDEAGIRKELLR